MNCRLKVPGHRRGRSCQVVEFELLSSLTPKVKGQQRYESRKPITAYFTGDVFAIRKKRRAIAMKRQGGPRHISLRWRVPNRIEPTPVQILSS
jgi:hypothetical protein